MADNDQTGTTTNEEVIVSNVEVDPLDAIMQDWADNRQQADDVVVEDEASKAELRSPNEEDPKPQANDTEDPDNVESVQVAKGLAKLTRKEKALRAREESIKQEAQRLQQFQQFLNNSKQNPLQLLDAAGLTLDDLAEYVSKGVIDTNKPDDRLSRVEQQLEEERKARLQYEQEVIKHQQEATIDKFKTHIGSVVDTSFPLIKANNASDVVFEVINQYFTQTNQILPVEQAAQLVEEEIRSIKTQPTNGNIAGTEGEGLSSAATNSKQRPTSKSATLNNKLASQPTDNVSRKRTQEEVDAAMYRIMQQHVSSSRRK